jgi:predicted dehydrogenase
MNSNKKIKIGVFGAHRGMTMINVLSRHPDAELVAICDKYQPLLEKCKKVAEETGSKITYYTSFDEFFNHDMDAVVLANYANEHAAFAIKLLMSGRHVVSEVLPVETLGQAVELAEAVEKSGKIYSYAENYCYFAATQEMKSLYRAGEIGEFMHGEGEYIHDCEAIWPDITYGDKDHWRNRLYSTYYCTHSLGPIVTITGLRPVKVVGFETPNVENMAKYGYRGGTSGMIVAQMNNGATVKSLHGYLKREPTSVWYSIYGKKGMIESDRWHEGTSKVHIYREGGSLSDTEISYRPKPRLDTELSKMISTHGGGDFYTMHYFLEKILGRPEGEECVDIYQALDMALPGILAYKSICNGNIPVEVPDFRDKMLREKYRGDNWCTNPEVAGNNLAPFNSFGGPDIPDSVYEQVRMEWQARQEKENS